MDSANCSVHRIRSGATQGDILNELQARQAHLAALLAVASDGNGLEVVNTEEVHNFLWACEWIANDCRDLAGALLPPKR